MGTAMPSVRELVARLSAGRTDVGRAGRLLLAAFEHLNFSVPRRFAGRRFRVPVRGIVGAPLLYAPTLDWMSRLLERLLPLSRGRTFVDVGVNLGQTLLRVASLEPGRAYVGFEPNPRCVAYVESLLGVNDLDGWRVLPLALADAESTTTLFVQGLPEFTDSAATIVAGMRPGRAYRELTVVAARFDALFPSLRLPPVGVVKMDVEGAELEALRGMSETLDRDRPVLLLEVLLSDERAGTALMERRHRDLAAAIARHQYEAFHLVKDGERVHGLRATSAFPSRIWTARDVEACDYLVVPREDRSRVLSALALPLT